MIARAKIILFVFLALLFVAGDISAATYYVDNTKETGVLTGANWQFSNGSGTVSETGTAGNALAELSASDYVRTNGGIQWYRVTVVSDDDTFTITPNFQQGTNTDTCKYNDENGTAIAQAYPTPLAGVTDNTPGAGDTIKLRANQTHVLSGVFLAMTGDGTANNFIAVKGCDSVDDPWSDGSDVAPIIDFNDTAVQIVMYIDDYFKIQNLEIIQSSHNSGAVFVSSSAGIVLEDLVIHDNENGAAGYGIRFGAASGSIINCTLYSNKTANILVDESSARISGCTLNGGGISGLTVVSSTVVLKDSTFGVASDHSSYDIYVGVGAVYGRNVLLDSAIQVVNLSKRIGEHSFVRIEDDAQVHEAYQAWYYSGIVSKSTVVERSGAGGTAWSILGEPNSGCGSEQALYIIGDWFRGVPIYLDGTEQKVTLYAYADSTGGSWTPNASEFYIEIEHYEGAADWEADVSTDTFAAEDQWESWEITLTPGAAGVAYLRVVLKDYEDAGSKVYVDPTLIIE